MRNGNTSVEIVGSGEFRLIEQRHYQHVRSGLEIAWDRTRWRWVTSDGAAFLVLYDAAAWLRQSLQAASASPTPLRRHKTSQPQVDTIRAGRLLGKQGERGVRDRARHKFK